MVKGLKGSIWKSAIHDLSQDYWRAVWIKWALFQLHVILLIFKKNYFCLLIPKTLPYMITVKKNSQNKANLIRIQNQCLFSKELHFKIKMTYAPFWRCRSRFSDFFIPLKLTLDARFIPSLLIFTKICATWGNACLLAWSRWLDLRRCFCVYM